MVMQFLFLMLINIKVFFSLKILPIASHRVPSVMENLEKSENLKLISVFENGMETNKTLNVIEMI